MGFFQRLFKNGKKTLSNGWNTVKTGGSKAYKILHGITNGASKGAHWLDNFLGSIHTGLPIIDDAVNMVKENPLYNSILGTIDVANTKVETIGMLGKHIADLVDDGVSHLQKQDYRIPPGRSEQVRKAIEVYGKTRQGIERTKQEVQKVQEEARKAAQVGDFNAYDSILDRIRSL